MFWASAPSPKALEAPGYPLYLSITPFGSKGEDVTTIPLAIYEWFVIKNIYLLLTLNFLFLMFRFLPVVVIIQVFCLYHAYKNKANQLWFWLIIFFPLLGSILYLYDHFFNKKNVAAISEGLKGMVNSNYEVEQLEKELKLTDSYTNKMKLANKYLEVERTGDAIHLFESCLKESQQSKEYIYLPLMEAYYDKKEYLKVTQLGSELENNKEFNKSRAKIFLAWSWYRLGKIEEAHRAFQDTDLRFSNYWHRLQFIAFLQKTEQFEDASAILEELQSEFTVMTPPERKQNRQAFKEVQALLKDRP